MSEVSWEAFRKSTVQRTLLKIWVQTSEKKKQELPWQKTYVMLNLCSFIYLPIYIYIRNSSLPFFNGISFLRFV